MHFPTIEDAVGHTPLVRLKRIGAGRNNVLLAKLEGNNPAGSVKDRPAMAMLEQAEARGDIAPGDTLIEATSGNTGIALAMAAAIKGYRMVLIMPESASEERKQCMAAYGARLITVSKEGGMEEARDLADAMLARGDGKRLDQFANPDNPLSHYLGTGREIWEQTAGTVTHFVSSMGTTGTIMGASQALKERNADIEIIGLQPEDGASIAGIRRWPEAYLPSIFDARRVDRVLDIGQHEAEEHMRRLAREEGILAGVSSGGALAGALRVAEQVENAVIAFIVCDRGDRYLSTGLFAPEA
uniref:cysteine synthase CysM n=1 Tax=uncultured Halomonas sp. TaxID=173971 RepID=UPI0026064782|nr:cysteine synthase CysM [uncultured Halomonas sp.]